MSLRTRREAARQERREQTIALGIRRQARRAQGERRRVLEQLLADDDAFEAAVLAIADEAPDEDEDGQQDGPILRLLQWLLDHFDEIFSIIVKIIGLFAGALAMPAPGEEATS